MGSRLRCDDTCPNDRSRSISSVPPGFRSPARIARLVAMVVVPTPPFGLNTDTIRRPRGSPIAFTATRADRSFDRWNRSGQPLDARLELHLVERLGDDVVGAGLEQGDPLLEVVGLRDRQDRQVLGRVVPAQLLDHRDHGERGRDLVDDDEAVAGRGREQVDGIGHGRHTVTGRREGRRQRLARDPVGREEENRELQRCPRAAWPASAGRSRREGYRVAGDGLAREPPCYPSAVLSAPCRHAVSGADPIGRRSAGRAPL